MGGSAISGLQRCIAVLGRYKIMVQCMIKRKRVIVEEP